MAGEGRQGLARRLLAWEQKHNKRIPSNQLITSNKTIIMDSAGARTLLEAINQMNLDNVQLLVIDTLSRHMDGEENSNTAMGDFMTVVDDIRDRLGCSVVIIHHPGYGNGTQNRARGASAFYAALDFELLVKQTQAGYSIKGTKSKEGQLWEEHIFDLEAIPIQGMYDNKGSQVKSAVINWKGKSDTKSGSSQTKAETKALRIFQVALDTSGTDRIVNGLNVRSIDLEKWREHSYQTCTTDNNNSKNTIFNRQKNTLLAAGLVEEHNDLYTLPIETKQNHNNVVTMLRTSSVT